MGVLDLHANTHTKFAVFSVLAYTFSVRHAVAEITDLSGNVAIYRGNLKLDYDVD